MEEQSACNTRPVVERPVDFSPWLAELSLPEIESPSHLPESAAVVIIGAGLTGASCAYWLKNNGFSGHIAILEQRASVAYGATGRNGGHIWPNIRLPKQKKLVKPAKVEELQRIFKFKIENFVLLSQFINDNKVDCDFIPNGALLAARKAEEAEEEREYMDLMLKYGMDFGFEWWDTERCQKESHSTKFIGGLYQKTAGRFWPARVVNALAQKTLSYGHSSFHFNSEVEDIKLNPAGSKYKYTVAIKGSREEIQTDIIIHATNGWASSLFARISRDRPYCLDNKALQPVRGQVLLTSSFTAGRTEENAIRWWPNLSFDGDWEYMIQKPDGRVVLGGMRYVSPTEELNTLDDTKLNCDISERLHQTLSEVFDGLTEVKDVSEINGEKNKFVIEREWTGIMCYTKSDNPAIGPLPPLFDGETGGEEKDGVRTGQYIAAGYTGDGMACAFAAAKALADMITLRLRPEDFVSAFSPSRFCRPQ